MMGALTDGEYLGLRTRKRKGHKKEVKIYDLYQVSERMTKDLTWGTILIKVDWQAYVPEVGQKHYDIPFPGQTNWKIR